MSTQEPFYLTRERMAIKVKMRTEKHGDEDVNAYDVMLYGSFPNAVLEKLSRELRPSLYSMEQADIIEGQSFTEPRFPELGVFDWALEMGRIEITIHDEESPWESLTLANREADKFNFALLPGGTVKLGLRVKVGVMDDEDALLRLLRASNQQMLVSLHQAEVEAKADNFEQAEQLSKEPHSAARAEAESLFSAPPPTVNTPDEVVAAAEWTNPPTVEAKPKKKKAAVPSLEVLPE